MDDAPHQQPGVVLVTGGARRIGRAVCLEMARRGWAVAVHANTSLDAAQQLVGELKQLGVEAAAFGADLRDEGATRAMIDRVHRRFDALDALVNSAAIWEPMPLDALVADDVRRFFDVNAVAPLVCAQHAGLIMADQPAGGAIVNLGDVAAHRPQTGYLAYHPSKGAIPTLTRALAVELAGRNPRVRVNAVLPGPVLVTDAPETPARRREVTTGTLLSDPGTAEHVAHAVAFLIENPWVTGVSLPVDGGRSIAGGDR